MPICGNLTINGKFWCKWLFCTMLGIFPTFAWLETGGTNPAGVYPSGKPYKGHVVTLEVAAMLACGSIVLFLTFWLIGTIAGSVFWALLFSHAFASSSEDEDALDILDTTVPLCNCIREIGFWFCFHTILFFSLRPNGCANLFSIIFCRVNK